MSIYKVTYNSDTMSWDHQFPVVLQSQPHGISPQTYAATLHKCDQIMYDRLKSIERRRTLTVTLSLLISTVVFTPAVVLSVLGLTLWARLPYLIGPVIVALVSLMIVCLLVPAYISKNKNQKTHREIRDELLSFLSSQNASIYAPSHLQLMLKDYDTERGFGRFLTYKNNRRVIILLSSGPTIEIVDTRGLAFNQPQSQQAYQVPQQQQGYVHYQPQPQQPVMYYQPQQPQQQQSQPQYQEYYQPSSLYQPYQIQVQRQETSDSKPTNNNF